MTYFLSPPRSETFPDLVKRGRKILEEVYSKHKKGNLLLVSHGDIGKMIYAAYYNLNWKEVLQMFHFGNSDLLLLSKDSKPEEVHVFQVKQYNL